MWWNWARDTTLTEEEMQIVIRAGRERDAMDQSWASGKALIRGKSLTEGHILGVSGEYAFCKMYDVPWNPVQSVDRINDPDAVIMDHTWEVKTTEDFRYMSLNVNCEAIEKHPWDLYALVYRKGNYFQHVGCATREKVLRSTVIQRTGIPFYAVRYRDLLKMRADWATLYKIAYDTWGPTGGWKLTDSETGITFAKASDVL